MKTAVALLCLASIVLVMGCASPRATPEEVRSSELAARASRSAADAAAMPATVTTQTKAACDQDLRSRAQISTGKHEHTIDSVQFDGNVTEYNMRNRPHAYDVVVSYAVRMAATGELVKSKQTCRVTDAGKVEWMAA